MSPLPTSIDGLTSYTAFTIQYEDHDSCEKALSIAGDDNISGFCVLEEDDNDLSDSENN